MRDIRFRLYDKDYKRMRLFGTDAHDTLDLIDSSLHYYNLQNGCGSYGSDASYVLMQYTGLKDKHGKEIYDSDIYKWQGYEVSNGKQVRPERIGVVEFEIYELFKLKNIIEGNGTLEIIGNIHEHPHLLGE